MYSLTPTSFSSLVVSAGISTKQFRPSTRTLGGSSTRPDATENSLLFQQSKQSIRFAIPTLSTMASSTSPSLSLVHALLLFALLAFASDQQCYYPNGKAAEGGSKDIPCENGSNVCCPQGWVCSSNWLCYNPTEDWWGRYTCTDQAWGLSCPNVCKTGEFCSSEYRPRSDSSYPIRPWIRRQ